MLGLYSFVLNLREDGTPVSKHVVSACYELYIIKVHLLVDVLIVRRCTVLIMDVEYYPVVYITALYAAVILVLRDFESSSGTMLGGRAL